MKSPQLSPLAPRIAAIVGGSGFIGTAVTEVLAQAGWRIRVISRDAEHGFRLKPLGDLGQIVTTSADVRNTQSLMRALQGADLVVNLVGALNEGAGQSFYDLHVAGAHNLAMAAAAVGATKFIHISALGADATSDVAYFASKAKGEEAVRAAFPAAVILRPGAVFGAEDRFTNRLAKTMGCFVIPVMAGNSRLQPVFVKDVAQAVLATLDKPATDWDLTGPDVITMRQLVSDIARDTDQQKQMVEIPDFAAAIIANLGFLPGMPITSDQYAMLKKDNVQPANSQGLSELGITPTPMATVAPAWLHNHRPGGRFAS